MNNEGKNKRKLSEKTKWIITGALCVLAVLTVVIVALDGCFDFKPGSVQANNQAAEESAAPESDDKGSKGSTHMVIVSSGNGGTTDPDGSVSVAEWGSVTVKITPDEGYEIKSVSIDGSDKGPLESYTLSNITEDHSIIVSFSKKPEPTPTPTPTPIPEPSAQPEE